MLTNSFDVIIHAIQIAVAPVFLLTGVGTLLNVLAGRLGRTVDRSRVLDKLILSLTECVERDTAVNEYRVIDRRVQLIYVAIVLAVLCALFICILVAMVFIDAFLDLNLARTLGLLFVAAMFALIASLMVFLREIFLAVTAVRHTVH